MNIISIALLITTLILCIILTAYTLNNLAPTKPDLIEEALDTPTMEFVKNVLPIDTTKYNITLKTPRPSLDKKVIYFENYLLENPQSTLEITFTHKNNILQFCLIHVKNGSVLLKNTYPTTVDAALDFLDKYQIYTKIDSAQLISLLQGAVNSSKDVTVTEGNLTLAIKKGEFPQGTQTNSFIWTHVIDGCEYTRLSLSFHNGTFGGFGDSRSIYRIGNTAINISMKQAVDIAKDQIKTYSYEMPGGVWISDFNVSATGAVLRSITREPYVLQPFWQVRLYLDKQYPGSVTNLLVHVWADDGEVFYCYHDSTGHKDY